VKHGSAGWQLLSLLDTLSSEAGASERWIEEGTLGHGAGGCSGLPASTRAGAVHGPRAQLIRTSTFITDAKIITMCLMLSSSSSSGREGPSLCFQTIHSNVLMCSDRENVSREMGVGVCED
jgi:hypothetical protein